MTVRPLLLLLTAAAGLASGPASAVASPADTATTQRYLQADYTLARAARSHLASSERAPVSVVLAQVQHECPLVAAGSPQEVDSEQLSNEVVGAIVLSAYRPDLQAIRQFIGAVSSLRWSSRALTRTVQGYAGKLRTLSALAAPALCADVRSWIASSFATLPASTVQFDQRFMPAWVALGELPGGLAAFERSEGKALSLHCTQVEEQLAEGEARVVETYRLIMNALALNP